MRQHHLIIILLQLTLLSCALSAEVRQLSIDQFVQEATQNDTKFEEILIEQLKLNYQHDVKLPAKDIVLGLKHEYNAFLTDDREEPSTEVRLSKLFPYSGTTISASYDLSPSLNDDENPSKAEVSLTQSIARNAFGNTTRLRKQIVGLEVDIASHQIIEAYEDYLAAAIIAYYEWEQAYEDLEIGKSSYKENLKLLDNIGQRQTKQIAREIDVNKIKLQVLAKKETLVELEEEYNKRLNVIEEMIRHTGQDVIIPIKSPSPSRLNDSFKDIFESFLQSSRTFKTLNALAEKSSLAVDKEADDLLPSINLVVGARTQGYDYSIDNNSDTVYAGISMQWPFDNQIDGAEHEIAKIDLQKSELQTHNARYKLYTDIKNLYHEIYKEMKLKEIAEDKIRLAESILEDERENYSFGKVTLNDYIDAVNVLDRNRFNIINHDQRYKILLTEWRRITDTLIEKNISYQDQNLTH